MTTKTIGLRLVLMAIAIVGALTLDARGASASQIYVCTGCSAPPGVDPNGIIPSSINIGFAGSHTAVAPLLVIVGIPVAGTLPTGGSTSAPTISLPTGVSAAAPGTYYGLNLATSGGLTGTLEGELTSASKGDAYTVSGIAGSGGGSSESFVNWTGNPYPGGGTNLDSGVTGFNLYAYAIDYALNSSGASSNSPITIDLSGLGVADYVIAYNCAQSGPSCSGGDIGATPFTNAGVNDARTVPDPATSALLGVGLLGLGFSRRKRTC